MSIRFERVVSTQYGFFVNNIVDNYISAEKRRFRNFSDKDLINKRREMKDKRKKRAMPIIIIGGITFFAFTFSNIIYEGLCSLAIIPFIVVIICIIWAFGSNEYDKELKLRNSSQERLYNKYQSIKYKYAHQSKCPICNALVEFPDYETLPFQGKCSACGYIFTVTYRKVKEKFITYGPRGGEHINRIFYDGVKAIKPVAQKVDYIDQSVKIDIKDSVLVRSTVIGKQIVNK